MAPGEQLRAGELGLQTFLEAHHDYTPTEAGSPGRWRDAEWGSASDMLHSRKVHLLESNQTYSYSRHLLDAMAVRTARAGAGPA